jgi:hypothetical protein
MMMKHHAHELALSAPFARNDRWILPLHLPLHLRHLSKMNKICERNYGGGAHCSPQSQFVPYNLHRETGVPFRLIAP